MSVPLNETSEHREKRLAAKREYARKYVASDKGRAHRRGYENSDKRRSKGFWHTMMHRYGLTCEDYSAILGKQMACCANPGCHTRLSPRTLTCCVDHDHTMEYAPGRCHKEAVRGILCSSCNKALGYTHDSEEAVIGLALYLESNRVTPKTLGQPPTVGIRSTKSAESPLV